VDVQRAVPPLRYVWREGDRYDAASFLIIGDDPGVGGVRLSHRCSTPEYVNGGRAVPCRVR